MPKKKLVQLIKQFSVETTIHGISIITLPKLHILERIFWVLIILVATAGAISLSLSNWNRFVANPTVVTLQKDFRNWNNPFPSATGCFVNKVDPKLSARYIYETWKVTSEDPEYKYYSDFIKVVANISFQSLHQFEPFKQDSSLNRIDMMELAAKVHPHLSGSLVTFDSKRKTKWTLIMTEKGTCFSINSKFANILAIKVDGVTTISQSDDPILKCHFLNGLCYARYDSDPLAPLQFYVHSYLDVIHATMPPPLYVRESEELEINYRMQETSSATSLRLLTPSQRNCRFDDEPMHKEVSVYSVSICYITCRYRLILKLCGCKPFFYHYMAGKLCNINGLLCVAKHMDYITKPPSEIGCECPQPCDLIIYLPQIPKITLWEYGYFDQRITFRWGLLSPTTRYYRDVLFGFEDLVVSFGATLAFFLGVSFMSIIEVVFFIIENLFLYFHNKQTKNRKKNKTVGKKLIVVKHNNTFKNGSFFQETFIKPQQTRF